MFTIRAFMGYLLFVVYLFFLDKGKEYEEEIQEKKKLILVLYMSTAVV